MRTLTWVAMICFSSSIAGAKESGFRDPKQVFEIIEKSKLKYTIATDSIASFDLRSVDATPLAYAHPNWIVAKDANGQMGLVNQTPKGCAVQEDSLAMIAFTANDYKNAVAKYRAAYECDKSYVKALTYLGNSFFLMEKIDSAKFWFRKAIVANPDDYQAHFFLADAYLTQGKADSAYFEFIEAYLRSPNNPNLLSFGEVVLQQSGKLMDKSWPVFGFSVGSAKDGVKIATSEIHHLSMASCLAAWKFDPEFKGLRKDDDPIQQTQYKNCLANQVVYAMMAKKDGKPLDRVSKKLLRVAELDLVGVMVVWERLSRSHPESIYQLAPEVKAKIHAYLALALEIE